MTKTKTKTTTATTKMTHNGRKTATSIFTENYALYFSRPVAGNKSDVTFLNVAGINPITGKSNKVRLDGRAVSQLRKVLAAS
jgi:hypothetical protein